MTSKSNILNLYDSVSGSKHYYQKLSTDQVELNALGLPMNLKASQFNLVNSNGQTVTDVVSKVKALEASIASEVQNHITAVSGENSTAQASIDALSVRINTEVSTREGPFLQKPMKERLPILLF